jgi:hypothetical protein
MVIRASEEISNTTLLPNKLSGPILLWGVNVKFYCKITFNVLRLTLILLMWRIG